MQKEISQAVIRRMPRYYRYLGELLDDGVERISSNELSVRMKVTASQIRQDLNNFGGFGQQGYGYYIQFISFCQFFINPMQVLPTLHTDHPVFPGLPPAHCAVFLVWLN